MDSIISSVIGFHVSQIYSWILSITSGLESSTKLTCQASIANLTPWLGNDSLVMVDSSQTKTLSVWFCDVLSTFKLQYEAPLQNWALHHGQVRLDTNESAKKGLDRLDHVLYSLRYIYILYIYMIFWGAVKTNKNWIPPTVQAQKHLWRWQKVCCTIEMANLWYTVLICTI